MCTHKTRSKYTQIRLWDLWQNNTPPKHLTPLHLSHQDSLSWGAAAVGWPLAALWEPQHPWDGEKVRTKTHKQTTNLWPTRLLSTVQAKGSEGRRRRGKDKCNPFQKTLGPSSGQNQEQHLKTTETALATKSIWQSGRCSIKFLIHECTSNI